MDLDDFYHRQKNHVLPLSYQYADSSTSPTQSPLRILPFEPFPRTLSDQSFVGNPSPETNIISSNYNLDSSFPMSQPPQSYEAWNDPTQNSSHFTDHSNKSDAYYESVGYITASDHGAIYPRAMNFADVPRSCESYNPRLLQGNGMVMDGFEPSAYMMDSNKPNDQGPWDNRSGTAFSSMDEMQDFPRLSISRSPVFEDQFRSPDGLPFDKPPPFRMPSSETSEDGGNSSREMTAVEVEDHGADEPYAKLIYRALMSAPNHSMVLQEIYQWFRDNTVKGSSDTKGWMNSIRHNLSMNAAFKKTERKLSGDETKKSTEWVLEDFAIKDGVQSTTRYRKGTANKRFHRSDTPAPNRQISGRKGGISASKGSRVRQRRDERADPRLRIPRIDTDRNAQFRAQAPRSHFNQRQRSPLTPPQPGDMDSSPYFFPKVEQFEMPYEGMCGLEDVQGVHIDDSPVFSGGQEMGFYGHQGMGNHDQPF